MKRTDWEISDWRLGDCTKKPQSAISNLVLGICIAVVLMSGVAGAATVGKRRRLQ